MAFTHRPIVSWGDVDGSALTKGFNLSADGEERRSVAVANGVTDQMIDLTVDVSDITLFYMVTDVVMTIVAYDGSSPSDTFVTVVDMPVIWYSGIGTVITDVFSADITEMYATNASGGAGTVEIRILKDT